MKTFPAFIGNGLMAIFECLIIAFCLVSITVAAIPCAIILGLAWLARVAGRSFSWSPLFVLALLLPAMAQTSPAEPVPGWAQFAAAVEPALMSFLAILVTSGFALMGVVLSTLAARITKSMQHAEVHAAASAGAAQLFASSEPTSDIDTRQIVISSNEVKTVAGMIKDNASDAVKSLGLSDSALAGKAQAAIGQLQINANSPPVPPKG